MVRKRTCENIVQSSIRTSPDHAQKLLEDYADVFADIINVLCFGGKEIVRQENLIHGPTESIYKAATENYRSKRRDVVKFDTEQGTTMAIYGIENQTGVSNAMPVRIMGYDYASYAHCIGILQAQNARENRNAYIREIWPGQKIPPTITLVLYFGMQPWNGPTTLHEMMDVMDDVKPYVPDYKINLIQVAFLDKKTIAMFKSDFRLVAEFFQAKRIGNTRQLVYNESEIEHVEALMELFHTFTGDERFRRIGADVLKTAEKGEPIKMCDLVQAFVDEGVLKGRIQGRVETRVEAVDKLIKKGFSEEKAMELLDITFEEAVKYQEWKNVETDIIRS